MKNLNTQIRWANAFNYNELTRIEIGYDILSASGVECTVTGIIVDSIHRGTPLVLVTYDWNDNGQTGTETVTLANFRENLYK